MDDQQGAAVALPAAVEEPQGRFLTPAQQARVEVVVRRELARVPRPSVDDVMATVASETGLRLSRGNLYRRFFTPIAKELGVARPRGGDQKTGRARLAESQCEEAPAPPAVESPGAPESTPPPPAPTEKEVALSEEVRSLRAAYESDDALSVRLIEEEGGRYRLSLSLLTTRSDALEMIERAVTASCA